MLCNNSCIAPRSHPQQQIWANAIFQYYTRYNLINNLIYYIISHVIQHRDPLLTSDKEALVIGEN